MRKITVAIGTDADGNRVLTAFDKDRQTGQIVMTEEDYAAYISDTLELDFGLAVEQALHIVRPGHPVG